MKDCRLKKRLQIYLDGWLDGRESERFEDHLRRCEECQTELIELEEISSEALEIVDHAPERDYWNSFFTRVHNRILARGANPFGEKKSHVFSFRIASYSVGVIAVAATLVLTFGYLSLRPFGSKSAQGPEKQVTAPSEATSEPDISDSRWEVNSAVISDNVGADKVSGISSASEGNFPGRKPTNSKAGGSIKDGPNISDAALYNIAARDFGLDFRSALRVSSAPLRLDENENLVGRLMAAYGGSAEGNFSINPDVVAQGILSSYGPVAGGQNGTTLNGHGTGSNYAVNPRWGYLGLPADTSGTDEFRRYMIELDLMLIK